MTRLRERLFKDFDIDGCGCAIIIVCLLIRLIWFLVKLLIELIELNYE